MARYKPFSRNDGMPKIMPTPAVIRPDNGIVMKSGRPALFAIHPVLYAPTARKAALPIEIWPV